MCSAPSLKPVIQVVRDLFRNAGHWHISTGYYLGLYLDRRNGHPRKATCRFQLPCQRNDDTRSPVSSTPISSFRR